MLVNPNLSGGGGGGEFTLPANVIYLIPNNSEMVKLWLRNFAAVSSIRHTQAKRGVFYLSQAPDIGQISDGFFLCNFWISSQIPSSHTLIVILTWNLDYYLKLSRETRRK